MAATVYQILGIKLISGNGNRSKSAEICLNLFWVGIRHLKPLCSISAQADGKHWGQFTYGFAFEIFNVKNFHQNHSCTCVESGKILK